MNAISSDSSSSDSSSVSSSSSSSSASSFSDIQAHDEEKDEISSDDGQEIPSTPEPESEEPAPTIPEPTPEPESEEPAPAAPSTPVPESIPEPEQTSEPESEESDSPALSAPIPVPRPVGNNLIANPSLETKNGDVPSGWTQGTWGTNDASFEYPVSGHSGDRAAHVVVSSYTDGDAKWFFDDVKVSSGKSYAFSDWYRSDTLTDVTARYTMTDGSYGYVWLGSASASSSWTSFSKTFTVPAGAVSVTVFHLIASVGRLSVDDFSIEPQDAAPVLSEGMVSFSFDDGFLSVYEALPILDAAGIRSTQAIVTGYFGYDGYVNESQVRDMAARGHEIASHTRTHAHLTRLSTAELESEVAGSKNDLAGLGISATSFVYPYGEYDQTVVEAVRAAGYVAARSVDEGYNDADADPYLIRDRHITSDVTFDTVKGWIDTASESGQWLVLEMHAQTADPSVYYGNDPDLLRRIVEYVRSRNVKTVTLGEGAATLDR